MAHPFPKASILECGRQFFPHLLEKITKAHTQISLETYIFAIDRVGKRVARALVRASQRGVKVRIIIDWFGSRPYIERWQKFFARDNITLYVFNPSFKKGVARTHRKIIVIDDSLGYVGGINIKDDLKAGDGARLLPLERWDVALAMNGVVVAALQNTFDRQWAPPPPLQRSREQWHYLKERIMPPLASWGEPQPSPNMALITRDNFKRRTAIQAIYRNAIRNAQQEIILVTPYFAPGVRLRRLLTQSAARGVKITLVIGVGEWKVQDFVGRAYYPRLLAHGITIYEYRISHLHAKLAIVDNAWVTLGSSNCDALSLFINHEVNVVLRDKNFATSLKEKLRTVIANSSLIAPQHYRGQKRYKHIIYWFSYAVYRFIMIILTKGDFR